MDKFQTISKIQTEDEYKRALERAFNLMDAQSPSKEGDELNLLADQIELYELHHSAMVGRE
ncbi:MAG: hypothetical protein ORN98_05780 [Alphaproteobacteria bacterium]|nr:hypothetical protein [Alphaproteobacteria bacterium]